MGCCRGIPQFQRNIQRALNRGKSNHQLEQQLWSECSRLLAKCLIYYNAYIYRNYSSAPSTGRITNGPTRSSERTRQAGSV